MRPKTRVPIESHQGFTYYFKLLTSQYFKQLKLLIIFFSLCPFLILVWNYNTDQLGTNPLAYLTSTSGHLSLVFLVLTLTITPLKRFSSYAMTKYHLRYGKRLADWNWIVRLRKIFGLTCFFYASLHLSVYLWFDQNLEWQYIVEDMAERPFILIGTISFFFLFIMAITSLKYLIKKLKKRWRIIHMSIYPVSVLCLCHYAWLSKIVTNEFWLYSILTFILLLYRVLVWSGFLHVMKGDTGMEVSNRRPQIN